MNQDIADVVRLSAEANLALVQGDIDGYLSRIVHAADYTLMAPFGGRTEHGFADSPARRATMKQFFRSGTLDQELVARGWRRLAARAPARRPAGARHLRGARGRARTGWVVLNHRRRTSRCVANHPAMSMRTK